MIRLLLIITLMLSGCSIKEDDISLKKRGAARHALFVQCMELAAKMPRQMDDDVSNIVSECSSSSYYMTNYIK